MTETTNRTAGMSQRSAARVAGYGLLLMTALSIFAFFFVLQRIIVPGNAAETVSNIIASERLFRLAIGSFAIVAVLDVVVAWAFYVLLEPVNKDLSLLTAWFRLVYAANFGIALANLFNVLRLLGGADYIAAFESDQLQAHVMLTVNAFYDGWELGLLIFGFHLFALGYLFLRSGYIPRIVSILVIVASLGYLIDAVGRMLLSDYELRVAMFTFIGEVLLIVWLLARPGRGRVGPPGTAAF